MRPLVNQKSGQLTSYGLVSGHTELDHVALKDAAATVKLYWDSELELFCIESKITVIKVDHLVKSKSIIERYKPVEGLLLVKLYTDSYSEIRFLKRWVKRILRYYRWNTEHITEGEKHFVNAMGALASKYEAAMAVLKEKIKSPMMEAYRLLCLV